MLGGVATRARLVEATSRTQVDRALAAREILVLGRGRYALPGGDEARQTAHRVSGTLSHFSAALHWGWAAKTVPDLPHVTLPRNRRVRREPLSGTVLHRADLGPDDVVDGVTSRDRTLIDCLKDPDDGAALAVADSALRDGFSPHRLVGLADAARGPGILRVRRLARVADGDAANPFESVLRSIALTVPGLHVRTQVPIYGARFLGRPDLVDDELRIILEADSFEWHGGRAELKRDARRYNDFVVHGWLVLRFAWEDVMFEPAYVREVLETLVARRTHHTCWCPGSA